MEPDDRQFEDGTELETPDGDAEIVGLHSVREETIVYEVLYHQVPTVDDSEMVSTLSEGEIIDNEKIRVSS